MAPPSRKKAVMVSTLKDLDTKRGERNRRLNSNLHPPHRSHYGKSPYDVLHKKMKAFGDARQPIWWALQIIFNQLQK
jgi:hypothetical protein